MSHLMMNSLSSLSELQFLKVSIKDGIALVEINRPSKLNATNLRMHFELGAIWPLLDRNNDVMVTVITGVGRAFCAGGDVDMVEQMTKDMRVRNEVFRDARALPRNMIEAEKPIISAINGVCVGAGMVVAVCADIPIASTKASFGDGHIKLGVAAGDHATMIWPLAGLGMAKTKKKLLLGEMLDAREAERCGLIAEVTEPDDLLPRAMAVARALRDGPQMAIRHTKWALNQHYRQAMLNSFELSSALEMLDFSEQDVQLGIARIRKQAPRL